MSSSLPSYFRTHRRRSGLSQRDVAFLLGARFASEVSRYERRRRKPSLANAMGLELIFGTSARQLFPGLYQQVEADLCLRAQVLAKQLGQGPVTPSVERRIRYLELLAARGVRLRNPNP